MWCDEWGSFHNNVIWNVKFLTYFCKHKPFKKKIRKFKQPD